MFALPAKIGAGQVHGEKNLRVFKGVFGNSSLFPRFAHKAKGLFANFGAPFFGCFVWQGFQCARGIGNTSFEERFFCASVNDGKLARSRKRMQEPDLADKGGRFRQQVRKGQGVANKRSLMGKLRGGFDRQGCCVKKELAEGRSPRGDVFQVGFFCFRR